MFSCQLNADVELRLLEPRYSRALFEAVQRNRAELAQWLPWVKHVENKADMRDYIEFEGGRYAAGEGMSVLILHSGQASGVVSFQELDWRNRKTSLGYWLAREYQYKGIMTAACREMVKYAFVTLELNRAEIRSRFGNARSRGVAERLGFTLEGTLRQEEYSEGNYYDHVIYGLVKGDGLHGPFRTNSV